MKANGFRRLLDVGDTEYTLKCNYGVSYEEYCSKSPCVLLIKNPDFPNDDRLHYCLDHAKKFELSRDRIQRHRGNTSNVRLI